MKDFMKRSLTCILALCMLVGLMAPVSGYAAEEANTEAVVEDYATFLTNLKVLENYAVDYAAANGGDAKELILNYIRTGVERYQDDNWTTLAGTEKTAFVTYVAQKDAVNNTNAGILRNIELFDLPNGDEVDFGHMFGTMNIAYVNSGYNSADLGGWAGDICDLMLYSKDYGSVPAGTVEEMAAFILANCFGVDADNAFGMDDFYGDMDAFYLIASIKNKTIKLSAVVEAYFNASLSNEIRAEYFMKNRFQNLYTKESVREAVYAAYKDNVGIQILEAKRGLSGDEELRKAACYAFADYLYSLAGDTLEEPSQGGGEDTPPVEEELLDVYSKTESVLAPGISQSINYAYTQDNKQVAYYYSVIDVTRDDVHVFANYKDNDPSKGWGMQRLVDQMNAAQLAHSDPNSSKYIENYRAIVGINADFYNMSNGAPSNALVMEGVTYNGATGCFFAILKDGTPFIGTKAQWTEYKDQVQEAVGGSIIFIQDGKLVENSSTYYSQRGTRSCVGITADGQVIFLVVDGRQEPFSVGTDLKETAQILLDAGCVMALHLDGGGSATYASKPAGSDTVKLISSPSDGYQRSVSSTLVAVSTAKSSNEFEYANISSDYDYLTIGTQLTMSAVGVSNTGGNAAIPEGATWMVSKSEVATIDENGVLTAVANGEVQVWLVAKGEIIGKKTLQVVQPDTIAFEKEEFNIIYGVPTKLPVIAYYNGNMVATNSDDFIMVVEFEEAGAFEGQIFVANKESGIRKVLCMAMLAAYDGIYSICTLDLYDSDEAIFDFDNATAGNSSLAWNRDVTNATTLDNYLYQIVTPGAGMSLNYTFAIDMESLQVPEQLAELTYMLPGADADASAFTLMLQLAERISVKSEVRITTVFDKNLNVDISDIKVVNEYFELREATLDPETNTLTLVCGWIDRTAAIDPATANSNCILSGITATPKNGAAWDSKDQLAISNTGEVSYKIYLRANALYNFANIQANQEKYGLVPFDNTDIIINGDTEKGAWFGQVYTTFEDSFVLDSTNRQGWDTVGEETFYFVNNVPVTGIQKLPMQGNPSKTGFYEFSETGALITPITGLVEYQNALYYAVHGEMKTGWQVITDSEGNSNYYFFNTASGKALNGTQKVAGYTYEFTDYILTKGQLVTNQYGTRYMWAGAWVTQQWLNLDGKIAYADQNAYFKTGMSHKFSPEGEWTFYAFGDDGFLMTDYSGIYNAGGKETYLLDKGIVVYFPGLFKEGDDYYYITSANIMIKDRYYWLSKTNGIVPEGSYYFDAEGKLVLNNVEPDTPVTPPATDPDAPVKNGIVEENGGLYYYVNGKLNYAGLIQIDGDYYYVRTSGQLVCGQKYWISKTNGLLPEKSYTFDATGKLVEDAPVQPPVTDPETPVDPPATDPETPVDPPVTEPETPVKNGIVEENGGLYYYKDGKLFYAGLIQIDGDYYYVNTKCEVIHGKKYWISKTNGLLPEKAYTFDATGKMVEDTTVQPPVTDPNPPATDPETPVKNGIVEENGGLYYYKNGKLFYAGLIQIDGDYYYVNTKCQVICNQKYWISKTNGLLPEKSYTFDATGKIVMDTPVQPPVTDPETPVDPPATEPETPVKNGIVEENGKLYYYKNGKLFYAGLIQIDGDYYYVNSQCEVIHSQKYWISKTNGLLPEKAYTFDENGKILL